MSFVPPDNPFELFDEWYKEHLQIPTKEPYSMVLSTCSREGRPSSRVVLLKRYDADGFVFFTNMNSRKGRELQENNHAALLFYWLSKQVRIEGYTTILDPELSDKYFASRPYGAQVSAICSKQSEVIDNLNNFHQQLTALTLKGEQLARPSFWGGIQVVPNNMEFWLEGADRLHTRYQYSRNGKDCWKIVRLYP